ncbi:MAG: hypothetical protein HYX42_00080 [Polaromonas sp.]|uniref:hypothetical protein n=1 Tax=Polaromonas sp. TaxID=1869339 RepID=UPI0025D7D5C0|nr:hypothetical protein [Polaromonas sp.]MBI2724625.1 hypothetical protein [Polaromonas sp.]
MSNTDGMDAERNAVLAYLDGLSDEAAAHIFPSDLEKCQTSECSVKVCSVRAGNPDEHTVPLFSREQVVDALAALRPSTAPAAVAGPVATVYTMEALVPRGHVVHHATFHKAVPAGTKLCAAPPPAQPAVVTDARFPVLSVDEMGALQRFAECAEDGDGHDVSKSMMARLCEIGVLRRINPAGHHLLTEFGSALLAQPADGVQGDVQWTAEEIEAVICCLDDDAAAMLNENEEDERAHNMQRAATMIQVFSVTAPSVSGSLGSLGGVPRFQWCCNAGGCGPCEVKRAEFEYYRSETPEGQLIERKTFPQLVSMCCSGDIFMFDNEKQEEIYPAVQGFDPSVVRAAMGAGGVE